MNFLHFQLGRGFSLVTARAQVNISKNFEMWAAAQQYTIQTLTYNDLMEFVEHCRSSGNSTHTLQMKVKALEHYFTFLNIQPNPATLVKLQGGTRKIPTKLLTPEELTEIWQLHHSGGLAGKRDKVLLSLAIFQGIGSDELGLIEVTDVDLFSGTVYVPASRSANSRTLELKPFQLLLVQDYLQNIRPELLRLSGSVSSRLLVNSKPARSGKEYSLLSNTISRVLKQLHLQYPKLESLRQIRQSVITQWVREHGLRKAQYLAGHKYVSSTERYNVDRMEGLKSEVNQHLQFR